MFFETVERCAQAIDQLEVFVTKAEEFASVNGFDPAALMMAQMAPDMQPFVFQVQAASFYARGGALALAGQELVPFEDYEPSPAVIRDRVRKTAGFLRSLPEDAYDGAECRLIPLPYGSGRLVRAQDYALQVTIPNVLFHLGMAYGILRQHGVDLGKSDFMGPNYGASA